jgi:SAM-dependent methyltransferase
MIYTALSRRLPGWLRRWVLRFETDIESATARFSLSLADGARVLDAGAGELQYAHLFARHRYLSVDLAIGDTAWDYTRLDCVADLAALPVASCSVDACINLVTLEHVAEPGRVLAEIFRALRPGGRLLLAVPMEWEVHQAPHDYYRYTEYGVRYLLSQSGFDSIEVSPCGGIFTLISRRLLNSLQYFPGPLFFLGAILIGPLALFFPLLDPLDRERNFTLGYLCYASKPS